MFDSYSDLDSFKADESIADHRLRLIVAFDVLQMFGLISLSVILCTVRFSSRVRRSTAWFSFNFAWAFSCVGYLLILGYQTGPFPGHVLCLCQAMLIYACPSLNALTFVSFMLEIFLSISEYSVSRTTMIWLYFVPYGVFVATLIEVLIIGLLNPTSVFRDDPFGMFCHMSIRVPSIITSCIVIGAVLTSLTLGVYVALQCRRRWSACQSLLIRNSTPFTLLLRIGLVGICSVLSIGLAIFESFMSVKILSLCSNISLAMLPTAVGVIFGSQGDILRVWTSWRKAPQDSSSISI